MHQALTTVSQPGFRSYLLCVTFTMYLSSLSLSFLVKMGEGDDQSTCFFELMGLLNEIMPVMCPGRGTDCVHTGWGDHHLHHGPEISPVEIHSTASLKLRHLEGKKSHVKGLSANSVITNIMRYGLHNRYGVFHL